MFEQVFKNIDDILWKEGGCSNALDYVEQTSWVLFLKYLDNLEAEREEEAELRGETYERIIDKKFRWNTWAAPKTKNGEPDHAKALTGDDLTDFVNNKLFPYLKKFKETATTPQSLEYKIGEIFGELRNKITSGYNLREILWYADALSFQSSEDKHEMSHLYEDKIRRMGNAGRNGGEYYTPRPLIRTIVRIIDPKIGETVLDPACGSAGFLCEAYAYMKQKVKSIADKETLQKKTFYGQEKKGLAYIIGIMNMILHGVNAPNILHTNTLSENMANVEQKMRKDVIIANPPFGGKERAEVQQNFPIKTSETAYLFMQYFVKLLKAGGRAGIVIKNTFLSNTDNASVMLRKELLENCDLHTILDLPRGVFTGAAGEKTVVIFFEKGRPTEKIWYYQPNFGRNLGKTNPLTEDDLVEFVKLQKKKTDSEKSWTIDVKDLNPETFDLTVKNPNKGINVDYYDAKILADEIRKMNKSNERIFDSELEKILLTCLDKSLFENCELKKLEDVCDIICGCNQKDVECKNGEYPIYGSGGEIGRSNEYRCPAGCTIIGRKGSINNPIFVNEPFWNIDTAFGLSPKENIDARYLFYFCKNFDFTSLDKGSGRPSLKRTDLLQVDIPLPPLSIQKEIVARLDKLSENVKRLEANYKQVIADCDELKKSILKKTFEGES